MRLATFRICDNCGNQVKRFKYDEGLRARDVSLIRPLFSHVTGKHFQCSSCMAEQWEQRISDWNRELEDRRDLVKFTR